MEPRIMLNLLLIIILYLVKCDGQFLTHDQILHEMRRRFQGSHIPYVPVYQPTLRILNLQKYNVRPLFHSYNNYYKAQESSQNQKTVNLFENGPVYQIVRHINCQISSTLCPKVVEKKPICHNCEDKNVAEVVEVDKKLSQNEEVKKQDFLDKSEEVKVEKQAMLDKNEEVQKHDFLDKNAEVQKQVILNENEEAEVQKQVILDKNEKTEVEKQVILDKNYGSVVEKQVLDKNEEVQKQVILDKNEEVQKQVILDKNEEVQKQVILDKNEEAEVQKQVVFDNNEDVVKQVFIEKNEEVEKQGKLDKNEEAEVEKQVILEENEKAEVKKLVILDKNEETEVEKQEKLKVEKQVTFDKNEEAKVQKQVISDKNEKVDVQKQVILDKNVETEVEKQVILDKINREAEVQKKENKSVVVVEKQVLFKNEEAEKQGFLNKNDETEVVDKNEDSEVLDENKDDQKILKEDEIIKTIQELDENLVDLKQETLTLNNGPTEQDIINEESKTNMAIKKRQVRENDRISELIEQESLIPPSIIKGMAENNLTDNMKRFLNQLDKKSLLEVIDSMKHDHISKADSNDVSFIEETFEKLRQSVINMSQEDKNLNKRKAHSLNAGSVFELLAEESTIKKQNEDYDYYYSDMSHEENEETPEPSFLELMTIANKHKANNFTSDI